MIDRGVEAPVPPRMVDQGGGPDRSGIVPPRLLRPFHPPVGGGGVLAVDLRLAVAVKSEGRRLINIACVKPLIKFFEVGRHKSLIFFQLSRLGAKP